MLLLSFPCLCSTIGGGFQTVPSIGFMCRASPPPGNSCAAHAHTCGQSLRRCGHSICIIRWVKTLANRRISIVTRSPSAPRATAGLSSGNRWPLAGRPSGSPWLLLEPAMGTRWALLGRPPGTPRVLAERPLGFPRGARFTDSLSIPTSGDVGVSIPGYAICCA